MASGQFGLGILRVKTVLDNPNSVHYGSESVVTGHVALQFLPKVRSHRVELNGPLDLSVIFQGTIKACYSRQYFPDIIKLFSQTATLHQGSFRAGPDTEYKFHFAMAFPETTDPRESVALTMRQGADGSVEYRRHVTGVAVEELPPTLSSTLNKNDSNLMGPGSGTAWSVDVCYSLAASIKVPGIDVKVVNHSEGVELLYQQPKVPPALLTAFSSDENVELRMDAQDDSLVPEHARPRGFRSKTKAFLNPTIPPKYMFDLGISQVPKHIFAGQQITFYLHTNERRDDGLMLVSPPITLDSSIITLIAHTYGKDTATGKSSANHEVIMERRHIAVVPAGPFQNGREHRKLVSAGVLAEIPSSFAHANIQRSYTLRIALQLLVAGQVVSRKRDFKVVVHPPVDDGPSIAAGLDHSVENEVANDDAPPAYEEAIAGSGGIQEMPPSWEEAQNGTVLQSSVEGR